MPTRHILVETGRGIRRHATTFLLAASVQAVCLTLLGIFVVLAHNIGVVARSVARKIELHAFLSDDADAAAVQDRIRCITGVAGTRLVTQEDALAELQTELGTDAAILEALDANPLPASVRVSLQPGSAAALLADVEAKIALLPGVTEVWSGQEPLARLGQLVRAAVWLGLALLIVVSLAVAFVVFQTVDSSIASRQREIEIMDLVGAGRSAIEAPFTLEGILQGLAAGACALIVVLLLVKLSSLVLPAAEVPVGTLVAVSLGLGSLLGLVGSRLALNRIRR